MIYAYLYIGLIFGIGAVRFDVDGKHVYSSLNAVRITMFLVAGLIWPLILTYWLGCALGDYNLRIAKQKLAERADDIAVEKATKAVREFMDRTGGKGEWV